MELRVVVGPGKAELEALTGFEASFVTDVVHVVEATDAGFTVLERAVDPPVRKVYELAGGWDVLVLAQDAERVVGVAATTCSGWNRRQVLDELHVAADRRRQGIARALLAEVVRIARANGAREVWAETQDVNVPAVRAYRRLGFRLSGLDTTLYAQGGETALFLSLPV